MKYEIFLSVLNENFNKFKIKNRNNIFFRYTIFYILKIFEACHETLEKS